MGFAKGNILWPVFAARFAVMMSGLLPLTLLEAAEPDKSPQVLTAKLHHLRIAGPREWSDFPEQPEGAFLELKFTAKKNTAEAALLLRQQDVKQGWRVLLNGEKLGGLVTDENDMVIALSISAGKLKEGENVLRIEPEGKVADDVRVGQVHLHPRPVREVLSEARLEVSLSDGSTSQPLPGRITIVSETGALQTVGAASTKTTAVRGRGLHVYGPGGIRPAGGEIHDLCLAGIRILARFKIHRHQSRRPAQVGAQNPPRGADAGLCRLRYAHAHPDALQPR